MDQKDKLKQGQDAKGISQTDKGYYNDLYQDLPQEVQDILMQTHPLMGKNENSDKKEKTDENAANAKNTQNIKNGQNGKNAKNTQNQRNAQNQKNTRGQRTRRPQREDVEEVREARMQQVGSEINEIKNAPQQEGAPTRYVSRRERSLEHTHHPEAPAHKMEEEDDDIQYVSVLPARKKSKITEEVTVQTTMPNRTKQQKQKKPKAKVRKEPEEMPFTDLERMGGRPRYEEWDFDERVKQEQLDRLYAEDDYDDEEFRIGKGKFPIIVGIVGLVLIIFLIFHSVSLRSKLQDAENQLSTVQDLQQRYEQVQLEKMELQEQLDAIQNPDGAAKNEDTTEGDTTNETTENKDTQSNTTATEGGEEYIVQENETPWSIAQKFYGNGAEYKKILDANGLTETSNIRPGDKLIIPAA